MAIGWQIYDMTGSAFDLGMVGLVQFLPTAVLVFVAGQVADRYERKRIVQFCLLAEALTALFLGWGSYAGWLTEPHIFLATLVIGTAGAFESPATSALLPLITPQGSLQRATAISSGAAQLATITGPALGGLAYAVSPGLPYGIMAVFWLAGMIFTGMIQIVQADKPRDAATPKRSGWSRDVKTVRNIIAEVGVLPRAHGSALFTRGETQAMVVTTLGTGEDEQYIDSLSGTYKEQFLLHYNFPPYSVGETGRMGGTKRREIGHGKLAWRAIHPVLPPHHEFPYTVRVVSEITESNGSSSMASVCGASLALMDAGVPLKRPTAGIAMGLILEGSRFAVLSDILGDEDHLGDMDFKVPAPIRASPRCRWTSRSRHHRRDHEGRPRPGQGRTHPYPG